MLIAALLVALTAGCRAYRLTVLHTNDVHARFQEFNKYGGRCTPALSRAGECFGGVARQATQVREIRETNENVLFLNAGDYFQGTSMYTVYKWKVVADFMNRLGHDVMAVGNHEFDDGVEGLLPFLEEATFPVLGCNVVVDGAPSLKGKILSSVVRRIGGRKIGIVGYVTPDTTWLSRPGNVTFRPEDDCLRERARELKAQGVDIVVALGHSGFAKDLQLARDVPDLDLVVGGHTDTFLYTGEPPSVEKPLGQYPVVVNKSDGSKTLVVQDYTYGKYLGFLQVDFTDDGRVSSWRGNPILLDASVQPDPLTASALKPYADHLAEKSKEVVGQTRVLLLGERSACRMRECNMGNMLTDAVVAQFSNGPNDGGWTSVGVALWNSGGIRSSIDERFANGSITAEDVTNVIPFANVFLVVELKGDDLLRAMEESVQRYDASGVDPAGAFLQVSGIKIWYDLKKPPKERVQKMWVRCAACRVPRYLPVNATAVYKVAVPDFVYNRGDGFTTFVEKSVSVVNTGLLDSQVVERYLRSSPPLTVGLEDRINFVEEKACLRSVNFGPSSTHVNFSLVVLLVLYSYLG